MKKSLARTGAVRRSCLSIALGLAAVTVTGASAFNIGVAGRLQDQIKQDSSVIEIAIAAGAAIGLVAAATGAAWADAPPAQGYCWYYTDPSRTQGFWDVCPQ